MTTTADKIRALPDYDTGLLNDHGGGNVEWWQDYLRAEIDRANDHWREQAAALKDAMKNDHKAYFIGAWSSVVGWDLSQRVKNEDW